MMAKKNVLVLLGPNLNMVGIREKGVYGNESEESIERQIREEAEKLGYHCEIFQSNWEGASLIRSTRPGKAIRASSSTQGP